MENSLEATAVATTAKSQQIKITLEKLDGGFISDVEGKRKIYKDMDYVMTALDIAGTVDKLAHAEYKVNIDIVHADDYQDFADLTALHSKEISTLADAKEAGIIEVEKFNPLPAPVEPDLSAPIKVTAANCYTTARLKAINWKEYSTQLEMPIADMAVIAGVKKESFYATWAAVMKGTCKFQRTDTKIGLTILAQYYEKTLGLRVSSKENCERMKEDMLKMIREIELMGSGKSFIKAADVFKKLVEMRTSLL